MLRSPIRLIPVALQRKVLLEGLRVVFQDALEDGDFEFLRNRWLKIEIKDLRFTWYISYQDDKLIVADKLVQENVCFSGNLNDLVLIAGRKEDPDTLFFQRRLSIEGDTELGLEVKNLMDSVDLEQLPKSIQMALEMLAGFVQKGIQVPVQKNGVSNAYSN